jgi:2-haloacid dehalogenase
MRPKGIVDSIASRTSGTEVSMAARHLHIRLLETATKLGALVFETGGTALDWHGGLVAQARRLGKARGSGADWYAFVNVWRRLAIKGIVGQVRPAFNMDDVHRRTLDDALAQFGLVDWGETERDVMVRARHRLDTWPDFEPALYRSRRTLPVVSS